MALNQRHLVADHEIHFRRKIAELNQWSISIFIDRFGTSSTHAGSTHFAEAISDYDYNFLISTVDKLDRLIGVDLKIVDSESLADIKYSHHSYDVTYSDNAGVNSFSYTYVGTLDNPSSAAWVYNDISINEINQDSWAYTATHEIGHALGLEHPFEDDDGDVYGDTYTATPDQTVMAYGYPSNGVYPDFYTSIDINALQEIWGLPGSGKKMTGSSLDERLEGESSQSANDVFNGLGGDDTLISYRGADTLDGGDGWDLIRAGNGRDSITGGFGSDDIYGGFGHNTFTGDRDGSVDYLYFKSDQFAYNYLYNSAGNSPNGEKVDLLMSLDYSDRIFIQGVQSSMLSFGYVNNFSTASGDFSGIGIYANNFIEAIYVGGDLSIRQLEAMTSGLAL